MSHIWSCDLSCDLSCDSSCDLSSCHVTELWMSWLEDEEKLVGTDSEARKKVYELFDRAVKDYLCKSFLFFFLHSWLVPSSGVNDIAD